jgi:hypothetical protein
MGITWNRAAAGSVAALLCVVLAACGSTDPAATPGTEATRGSRSTPETRSPDTPYEVTATVLDDGDGPVLCAGGVLTSLPPQCGGPPVAPWDWDATTGYQDLGGVRWGGYRLVGTWDGTTFALTEPPELQPSTLPRGEEEDVDFTPPCPEPDHGWPTGSSTTFEEWQAFIGAAQETDDLSAFWFHRRGPGNDPNRDVAVVAYTGDVDAHRDSLEEIWSGPLCVVRFERSRDELQDVQRELSDPATTSALGLHAFASSVDEVHQKVVLDVLVDEPEAQAALDARYGEGLIVLRPALTPVA